MQFGSTNYGLENDYHEQYKTEQQTSDLLLSQEELLPNTIIKDDDHNYTNDYFN